MNKEKAIAIVQDMVNNGYHLFNETVEQFAARFNYNLEVLEMFEKNFKNFKKNA